MTKYIARPYAVEAEPVIQVEQESRIVILQDGQRLGEDGRRIIDPLPEIGDYYFKDFGRFDFMAKAEFERKYINERNTGHSAGY